MAVSAFDLPQMWQKPAAADLLEALESLRVDPPVWNLKVSRSEILREQDTTVQHRREIAGYLSTIIKSSLAWMDDEEDREAVWNEASRRLTERCGRSGESARLTCHSSERSDNSQFDLAMGEITRRWPFEGEGYPAFDLVVREPPLTGDNLGLKTWGSSYVLAQMLQAISETSLSHLLRKKDEQLRLPVLELGSGTGLLGLAAAAIWQTDVILSDLPEIMPNLRHNAEQNQSVIAKNGGTIQVGALTWGGEEDEIDLELFASRNSFKIVIVADPLYDDDHPGLLASAVDEQLSLDDEARVMVMVPQRDAVTMKLVSRLREEMGSKNTPLECIEETVVAGQDDWGGDGDEEASQVKCWLGIFGRRTTG